MSTTRRDRVRCTYCLTDVREARSRPGAQRGTSEARGSSHMRPWAGATVARDRAVLSCLPLPLGEGRGEGRTPSTPAMPMPGATVARDRAERRGRTLASKRGTLDQWLVAATVLLLAVVPLAHAQDAAAPDDQGVVHVGNLIYGGGKSGACFADGFLDTVARETGIRVTRHFQPVDLASENLFQYPFVIMSGEGAFELNDAEKRNFKAYLDRGGFVLASAGCSNASWSASFQRAMDELYPDTPMPAIDLDHPMFHTVYDITEIQVKKSTGGPAAVYGLSHGDRLAVVFSPLGLNDTGNAGKGCCCCGGNEVRNARHINANILAYALTH